MIGLRNLPEELLLRVASHLDKSELADLRLVSKQLSSSATSCLFKKIVCYDQPGVHRLARIMADEKLQRCVRKVIILHPNEMEHHTFIFICELTAALSHLQALEVDYARPLLMAPMEEVYASQLRMARMKEDYATNENILKEIFTRFSGCRLRELKVKNLQDVHSKSVVESLGFDSIMRGIQKLSLLVKLSISDYVYFEGDMFPLYEGYHSTMFDFAAHLPTTWLLQANQLVELDLGFTIYWGYYPKVDLSQINLPHLKSLKLSHFTFSQQQEFDWIVSHGITLEEICLNDCPIIVASITMLPTDELGYPTIRNGLRTFKPLEVFFQIDWAHQFTALYEHCPKLRAFCFKFSSSKLSNTITCDIATHRYRDYFRGSFGSTIEGESSLHRAINMGGSDAGALARLLKSLGEHDKSARLMRAFGHRRGFTEAFEGHLTEA